jgi:ABC-type microcin C transport system duplicated ATPase subunit YejF
LARLLLRLINPSAGQVIYEGQDLTALSGAQMRALRSDLQFIFQDPFSSLNPRMSVEAIIAEPLRVHTNLTAAARRAKVADLMALVGYGGIWRIAIRTNFPAGSGNGSVSRGRWPLRPSC